MEGYIVYYDKGEAIIKNVGNNEWKSVCYGNGRYVAVGSEGWITMSVDGKNWNETHKDTDINWNDVTFGNGVFVACGDKGWLGLSSDGVIWATTKATNDYGNFGAIAFGNGNFCMIQKAGLAIYLTTDGKTIAKESSGFGSTSSHDLNIGYGNGVFVAFGGSNSSGQKVKYSTDGGYTWIPESQATQTYLGTVGGVTYGNGKFVAVGGFYYMTSQDGKTWSKTEVIHDDYPYISDIAFKDGLFMASSEDGIIYYTSDLKTWNKCEITDNPWLNAICPIE